MENKKMNSQHKHKVKEVIVSKVRQRTDYNGDYFICDIEIISEDNTKEEITFFSKHKNFMK